MKEIAVIMSNKEFETYLDSLRQKIQEGRDNGQDDNAVRCRLIGYVDSEKKYAFTGAQLRKIFDLGFSHGN